MQSKMTPGPWKREGTFIYQLHECPELGYRNHSPVQTNVFSLSVQGNGKHGASEDVLEANAKAIAAVPDLILTLETIEAATDGLSSSLSQEINRSARAALKKAGFADSEEAK